MGYFVHEKKSSSSFDETLQVVWLGVDYDDDDGIDILKDWQGNARWKPGVHLELSV